MRRPRPPRLDLPRVELPKEEADALHRRALAGDTEARNRIVEANLALAGWFAGKVRPGWRMDPDDALAAAMRGLVEAASRHDPDRGTKFTTTAYQWMRRALFEDAGEARFPVSVPQGLRKAPNYYLKTHGRGVSGDDLRRALSARRVDLAAARHRPDREPRREPEPDELVAAMRLLGSLPARQRAVVMMRLGLGGQPALTFPEIGARLGCHRARAQQLCAEAMAALARLGRRADAPGPGDCPDCGRPKTRGNPVAWWCRPCKDRADGIRSKHAALPPLAGRSGGATDGTDAA